MDVTRSWSTSLQIAFLAVAAVEEFAHVTPNVVLDGKSATRMLVNEVSYIENILV